MSTRPLKRSHLTFLIAACLALQALCIEIFPAHAVGISYPFLIFAPLLALVVCWRQARARAVRTRLLWTHLCVALSIWQVGILFAAWEDLFQHIPVTVAYFSDFLLFIYGLPVLLAISSPSEGEQLSLFLWLDSLQAAATAFLTYVTIFSVFPFIEESTRPLSISLLLLTYNLENFTLACAATLRLMAYPNDGEERRFYGVLCGFLWIYCLCVGFYNHLSVARNEQIGLYNLLAVVPFLSLAIRGPHGAAQESGPICPYKASGPLHR